MLRLRQIALVASDLQAAEGELAAVLDESVCFRDPGVAEFGLHNALFPVADRFVEIVSPTTNGTTAGRLIDKRGGDGGYMVILQTDELDVARKRIADAGVRIVFEAEGDAIVGLHLHPKDIGGAIVSIDQADDPASWPWAGRDWSRRDRSERITDLVGAEIQAADPEAMAASWSRVLGRPAVDCVIELDDSTLRFVEASDGRGDGLSAVDLACADPSLAGTTIEAVGTRFNLR